MFTSRCSTQPRVRRPTLHAVCVRRSSAARFVVSATTNSISNDPDLMIQHSSSRLHGTRHAGFGPLAGSWSAPIGERGSDVCPATIPFAVVSDRGRTMNLKDRGQQYPRVIEHDGQEGRVSALDHQRLDAMSSTGADSDRGGGTP